MTCRSRPKSRQKMWREMHHSSCHQPRFGGGVVDTIWVMVDVQTTPQFPCGFYSSRRTVSLGNFYVGEQILEAQMASICGINVTQELHENESLYSDLFVPQFAQRHRAAVCMFPVSFSTQLFFSLSSVGPKSTTSGRVADWH